MIGFVMVSEQRAGLRASSAESQTINPLRPPADPLRRLLHLPRHLQLPSRLVHDLRIECAVRAVALPQPVRLQLAHVHEPDVRGPNLSVVSLASPTRSQLRRFVTPTLASLPSRVSASSALTLLCAQGFFPRWLPRFGAGYYSIRTIRVWPQDSSQCESLHPDGKRSSALTSPSLVQSRFAKELAKMQEG